MGYWLSGLDEAGYGPLLGPLVVGLATLNGESELPPEETWRVLSPAAGPPGGSSRRIAVADSKKLHRPSTGDLTPLEEGVLAFVGLERGGRIPATFRELVDHLTAGRGGYLEEYPWYRGADLVLPVSAQPLTLAGKMRRLGRALERAGLSVAEVRAIPLEVREFNGSLAERGSKGAVNAWAMGRFLRWLWRQEERRSASAVSDRLGGRERYGPLLAPLFPGSRLRVLGEERDRQRYAVEARGGRRLEIRFEKEGEDACLPTALASMTAKYLRELHMRLFNAWWRERAPEIRPTAGYVTDGRRFLGEIEPVRRRLEVSLDLLVRGR